MDGVLSHSIKILIKYPYQVRDEINKSTQKRVLFSWDNLVA